MVAGVNIEYLTSYTAAVIDLSRQFCRGSPYLPDQVSHYIDVLRIGEKTVFAGPIGTSLMISLATCLSRDYSEALLLGGLVMSLSTLVAMVYMYLFIETVSRRRYSLSSVVISVFGSLPWVYATHIFPQAVLSMCYSAVLYYSARIVLGERVSLRDVSLHAVFSGLALLTDPTSTLTVFAVSLVVLYSLSKRGLGLSRLLVLSLAWASVYSVFGSIQALYNYATTGDPLLFPEILYSRERGLGTGFTTPLPTGLLGQTIDPRKSLLSLYPVSLVALLALPYTVSRTGPREVSLIYVLSVTTPLLVYSMWHDFHGGLSYGPRFLAPLTLVLSYIISSILETEKRYLKTLVVALTLYSATENSIVVVTTPYPCAFQDIPLPQNQFLYCVLPRFLGWGEVSRSALIYYVLQEALGTDPLYTGYVSATLLSLTVYILVLYTVSRRL